MRIKATTGAEQGTSWELPQPGMLNLGRFRQHSEICIHDPKLSRIHCQIECMDDGQIVVTDLDSESGTYINGERIIQQALRQGDVLKVGDSELRLQAMAGSTADMQLPKSKADIKLPVPPLKGAPTTTPMPSAVAAPPKPPAAPKTGQPVEALASLTGGRLGHFDLTRLVGLGHHGAVFAARDDKDNRSVALKVLLPDFPKNEEEMQSFVQTMKNLLPYRHPNLVTTFGIGRSQPYCWISRELVEGESLAELISRANAQGLPEWQQAFRLAVHLARALNFVHQRHLLHRNLAPHNILFRTADNLFKLADMGLAKGLTATSLRQICMRTKIQHELPYLSPEQTHPSPNLDPRSDIYSLGAVVYAYLTGKPPFAGKTSAETVSMIREVDPPEPKQWQPAIPEIFEAAILKMLAKSPQERFQTAAELLVHLAQIAPDPA